MAYRVNNTTESESSFLNQTIWPITLLTIFLLLLCILTLKFQGYLPLNYNNKPNIGTLESINLGVSFITATNLQIAHEIDNLSYLSKLALSFATFMGSLVGISAAFTLIRSFGSSNNLGNFYNDAINVTLLLYLPICLFLALLFVSQGTIQSFAQDIEILTTDGFSQNIPQGPVASYLAVKIFGVNGGGYFSASSAHPFENPNEFTNLMQIIAMLVIPSALLVCYGLKCYTLKHSTLYLGIFYCFLLISTNVVKTAETDHGLAGKELRYDVRGSAQYNTTSAVSSGSSNSDASKYSPISQLIFTSNILSGNLIFGGCGIGFTNFITMVILTAFLTGLMAGRTPILYGKRIGMVEISYIIAYLVIIQLCIFIFTFINAHSDDFTLRKFPEIFFNHVSAANNNGMGFLSANKSNLMLTTTTASMFFGRIAQLTAAFGLAYNLAKKRSISNKMYDINTNSVFFVLLLVFVILINMTIYLPFLVLWPILDIVKTV